MTPRIAIAGLRKRFAAPVLDNVSLDIAAGGIHGLVGENGAGKTTLIHILGGLLQADAGQIALDGNPYAAKTRREGLRAGISLATQELSLIETLSVAENILLSRLPRKAAALDRRALNQKARRLMNQVGLDAVDPATPVARLALTEKQLVELAKALSMPESSCKLLILDEPTSALTAPQAERMHEIVKAKARRGLGVIYVSHRLDDILAVCDTVSVLRDGRIELNAPCETLTGHDLIRAMSGEEPVADGELRPRQFGPPRLKLERLSSEEYPEPLSMTCRRGEIIGLAGLAGAGRSELLHTIFGLAHKREGRVELHDAESKVEIDSPGTAVGNGMVLIAEDRKTQGIFAGKPVGLNVTISSLGKLGAALAAIIPKRELRTSREWIAKLKVKCAGPRQRIDQLSGGNQQKLLLARGLQARADVWLLDEPTRGVDVGAKLAIHKHLREMRDRGATLLLASSDLEELMALCDRILVAVQRQDRGRVRARAMAQGLAAGGGI